MTLICNIIILFSNYKNFFYKNANMALFAVHNISSIFAGLL
jgi:hypothetical protein